MTKKKKKRGIKIKGLDIKVERDRNKKRRLKIKDFKGMNIKVEREIDQNLVKKSLNSSNNSMNDLKIQSVREFEVKDKRTPSILLNKFKKLKVKHEYHHLKKSSFQSLISLIGGKIYHSFNFINSLFDFFSYCNSSHPLDEVISSLDKLVSESKKNFPDLGISSKIEKIKEKFVESQLEECSKRSMIDLQYNIISWCREILMFGENNAKLYSNSVDEKKEKIVKKINWSLNRIKNNLLSIKKQYISTILTHVMILYKTSGVVLSANSFIKEELDGDLIGGFLTAIQSFGLEITKKETPMKKLSYHDFEIEIKDGNYVRIALILRGEPIPLLTQELSDFCKKFETYFQSSLENFIGDITEFKNNTPSLIEEIFS